MFEDLLERVATILREAGVPYMIIGGQAVLLYGEPRLTKDIDITLGWDLGQLPDMLDAVRRMGLEPLVDPESFTRQTMVLPCSDPDTGIRVDFIFSYSPYERQALTRARKVRIGNADVCFASVEDLLIHKVIAGRARDLEDVRGILIRNPDADREYIRRWLGEFSSALGKDFLEPFDRIEAELK